MLSQEQEEGLALEQVKQHRGTWGGTAAGLGAAGAVHVGIGEAAHRSGIAGNLIRGAAAATHKYKGGNGFGAAAHEVSRMTAKHTNYPGAKGALGTIGRFATKNPVLAQGALAVGGTAAVIGAGLKAKHMVDNVLTRKADARAAAMKR